MIIDAIAEFVLHGVFHGTGRVVVSFLAPKTQVNPLREMEPKRLAWYRFTYEHSGRRFFYDDTITLIGFLIWALVIAGVAVGFHMRG
ncbi:MAG: hypothetical protein R3E65_01030 [Steroidobacteraceae bacterium]